MEIRNHVEFQPGLISVLHVWNKLDLKKLDLFRLIFSKVIADCSSFEMTCRKLHLELIVVS